MAADDEGFLARWSRVKRTGDAVVPTSAAPNPLAEVAERKAIADAAPAEFDVSTLPAIDDLVAESDFAAFLQKGVPEELKRLALRKAWSLDPVIRDFVEVAENQYDWNAPDGVPGFGPLAAGTDIKQLLAQAIGQLPEVPAQVVAEPIAATPVADVVADPELAEPDSSPTVSITPATVAVTPVIKAMTPVTAKELPAETAASGTAPGGAARQRSRHGGALPQFAAMHRSDGG